MDRPVSAHVFVDDLEVPRLTDDDFHHLSRVLRLQPGEALTVSDGLGGLLQCRWTGSRQLAPAMDAQVAGAVARLPPPVPPVVVAFSPVKGDRPDWAVQKMTEAGADRVILIDCGRSVVRWQGAKGQRGASTPARGPLDRLRDVARQAAMQSRRAWLPTVEGPMTFAEATEAVGAAGTDVALAVPGGGPLPAGAAVLVGPEGGWTGEELDAVRLHVSLGPHILRTETAAVAATALLSALRAGVVMPSAT